MVVLVESDVNVVDVYGYDRPKVPTICLDRDDPDRQARCVYPDLESALQQVREYRETFPGSTYRVWSFSTIA